MDVGAIGGNHVLAGRADVERIRERDRRKRLFRLAVLGLLVADYVLARWLGGDPVHWGWPHVSLPPTLAQ